MRYVSLTPEERREMLEVIGIEQTEDLFHSIPEGVRLERDLDIPSAVPEASLLEYFKSLGEKNASTEDYGCFLGAGAYNHFIPTIIDSIISRAEFYTAYTPYQPEVCQGTLQAMFEYQTLVSQLTGMEVANSSLYDGSSSLAEAVLMAARVTRRDQILIPASLHPRYEQVLRTYSSNHLKVESLPLSSRGTLNLNQLEAELNDQSAAVVVQSPNFFGVLEDIQEIADLAHKKGALVIAVVAEGLSLGLLKPPGELRADIVVGEGQSFGIPLGFGGPYLGFFATRNRFKRQMPGRLVGQTVDDQDRVGYVLTLATREQHIRREKATSNICTNQGLCALIAAIFLSTLGKRGIRELAEQNLKAAHFLRKQLQDHQVFSGPVFNEMVFRTDDPDELNRRLLEESIVGGLNLGRYFPDRSDQVLVCVTERNSRAQIERFVQVFQEVQVLA